MLVSPKNIRPHLIQKQRTLNFDTLNKQKENGIFILSDNYDDVSKILSSKLFKPQQLICAYTPKFIMVNGKLRKRVEQKDIYDKLREKTGSKIKFGKTIVTAYGQRNLYYDNIQAYSQTLEYLRDKRPGLLLQKSMSNYQEEILRNGLNDLKYQQNYLIIPVSSYVDNFRQQIYMNAVSPDYLNPVVMFLRGIKQGTYDKELFSKFDRIFFYNPNADAIIPLDIKDEDFDKTFIEDLNKILRLNNFNNGTDRLDDIEEVSISELEGTDKVENKKEAVKDAVLKEVAKTLKIKKIDDFDPSNVEEEKLALAIERKINSFINTPENLKKTLENLIDEVKEDREIKNSAIAFIETKRAAAQKLDTLSKGLVKEHDLISKKLDEIAGSEKVVEPITFNMKNVPEEIKTTTLASFDEEYCRKQHKEDLTSIFSAFSSSEYIPMTIDSFEIEDTSTDFDQIETYKIKYKTDEGKAMSIKLDVPKIIDGKYLYLGGNKKDSKFVLLA